MQEINESILTEVIIPRPAESHKGTFGHVLIIGGNAQYGGAAIFSASAAVYAGSGLVTTATAQSNQTSLRSHLPETMIIDYTDETKLSMAIKHADILVLGPGLGIDERALQITTFVFEQVQAAQILIIDGSAIALVAEHQLKLPKAKVILTPHQHEWQVLSGLNIKQQTNEANQDALKNWPEATLVLKSHRTQLYFPGVSDIYVNTVGTPAMATGGMGDTLTGIIAAFMAQFTNDFAASLKAAVYTHSAIGEQIGQTNYVVLPSAIIGALPSFMQRFSQTKVENHMGFSKR